ncbi:MAG: rod shape-determining protein MreD [Chloroflexota bacterium]|jgi:rod shape-determining protein MreD
MVYIGAILLFLASLVQSVVLPQAVPLAARPQLMVMLVVAVCLVEGLHDAIIWGFIGGLLLDLLSGPAFPLGSNALLLVLVALLASLGQADPFRDQVFVPLATVFFATVFYHTMTMVLAFVLGQEVPFLDNLLRVALPSAVLNTILMPVAYSALLWLSERIGRRVRVEW